MKVAWKTTDYLFDELLVLNSNKYIRVEVNFQKLDNFHWNTTIPQLAVPISVSTEQSMWRGSEFCRLH